MPQDLSPNQVPGLRPGAEAPDFSLPGVDGTTYGLDSFKDAKALVIFFTCNHCPYVQAWESRFVEVQRDYAAKGVRLLGGNSNDGTGYPEGDFAPTQGRGRGPRHPPDAALWLLDQVETRSLRVRAPSPRPGPRGSRPPTEDLEPPFEERVRRAQVPCLVVRAEHAGGLPWGVLEFPDELPDVRERAGQLVHDGDRRPLGRPGERVEVDADDCLPHRREGLGPVPVLEGDEDDVGREDAVPVAEGPLRLESRDPRVGTGAQDGLGSGGLQPPDDSADAGRRPVKQVDLDPRRDRAGEPDDLSGRESGDVPVHGNHGPLCPEEGGRRGLLRD